MEDQNQPVKQPLFEEDFKKLGSQLAMSMVSLFLGILAIVLLFVLFGIVLGTIGLVFGIICVARKTKYGKALAIWGMVLSLIGILASAFFGYAIYYKSYKTYRDMRAAYQPAQNEWIGKASPDFTVKDLNGNEIKLSDLKGKRVILDFWATWCPPCKKEIPHFIKLRNEIDANTLEVVGISSEDEKVLEAFVKENKINYPIVSDDNLPEPYDNIASIPTTFFIDRNGIIQEVLNGYHNYEKLYEYANASDYVPEKDHDAEVNSLWQEDSNK